MTEDHDSPERPRSEPEIIPPDRSRRGSDWRMQEFGDATATHRVYVSRVGPFTGILLLLVLLVVLAAIVLAFVGALLLWLPLLALIGIIAAITGARRMRRW